MNKNLNGPTEALKKLTNDVYRELPVEPKTFFTHPYYVGRASNIYPILCDDLINLFNGDYTEVILIWEH